MMLSCTDLILRNFAQICNNHSRQNSQFLINVDFRSSSYSKYSSGVKDSSFDESYEEDYGGSYGYGSKGGSGKMSLSSLK